MLKKLPASYAEGAANQYESTKVYSADCSDENEKNAVAIGVIGVVCGFNSQLTNTTVGSNGFCVGGGQMPNGKFNHCNGGEGSFTELGSPIQLFCTQNGAQYSGNN